MKIKKCVLLLIVIITSSKGYSQNNIVEKKFYYENNEITATYLLTTMDSIISLDLHLINKCKNDLYMFKFWNTTLSYYIDTPNSLFICHSRSGRYIGDHFRNRIIKINSNDSLLFNSKIICKSIKSINQIVIMIDYLNPYYYSKITKYRILKKINPYPYDRDLNKEMFTMTTGDYEKYCNNIFIQFPY